jgi:hypothetical protein
MDSVLMLDKGIGITKKEKFRNQQVIITVAVPVGKRIYVNENVGWGDIERVDFGRDDDYWEWQDNLESESFRWNHNTEYVMTAKGLEKVSKAQKDDNMEDNNEEGNDEENKAIDDFRRSREQIEQERQNKLRELEEIDRELKKSTDSTIYRYKPAAPAKAGTRVALRASSPKDSFRVADLLMSF